MTPPKLCGWDSEKHKQMQTVVEKGVLSHSGPLLGVILACFWPVFISQMSR